MIGLADTLKHYAARVRVCDKAQALAYISELVAPSLQMPADIILARFYVRENLGTTGLGSGFALPHCRIKECTQATTALVTLEDGIDFASIDNQKVDLLFALIIPEDDSLELLKQIAQILDDKTTLQQLRSASSGEELQRIMQKVCSK